MRMLLDRNLSPRATEFLSSRGHVVAHASALWTVDPGDERILDYACNDDRVLVSCDKDFGALMLIVRRSPSGILRLDGNLRQLDHGPTCDAQLHAHEEALLRGALVIWTHGRSRIVMPEYRARASSPYFRARVAPVEADCFKAIFVAR